MTEGRALADDLATLDSLSVAVLTDDVSDNYVRSSQPVRSRYDLHLAAALADGAPEP